MLFQLSTDAMTEMQNGDFESASINAIVARISFPKIVVLHQQAFRASCGCPWTLV
jgi:hypothetical protein